MEKLLKDEITGSGGSVKGRSFSAADTEQCEAPPAAEVDIYRDTPLRLMGYANEVGEAFRALVHVNWVRLSYGVASAYVLADTNDKAGKTAASLPENEEGRTAKIGAAAFDTLLWQALASVMIPGFVINRICAGSLYTMARTIPQVAEVRRKWITTGIGLGVIPFIVHPIDSLVHGIMDNTTRKVIGGVPKPPDA